jgi:hypothetical protein
VPLPELFELVAEDAVLLVRFTEAVEVGGNVRSGDERGGERRKGDERSGGVLGRGPGRERESAAVAALAREEGRVGGEEAVGIEGWRREVVVEVVDGGQGRKGRSAVGRGRARRSVGGQGSAEGDALRLIVVRNGRVVGE